MSAGREDLPSTQGAHNWSSESLGVKLLRGAKRPDQYLVAASDSSKDFLDDRGHRDIAGVQPR
jgi:hypothetical protein